MNRRKIVWAVPAVAISVLALGIGCTPVGHLGSATKNGASNGAPTASAQSAPAATNGQSVQQRPASKEKVPTGDIPDTQKFVVFDSTSGRYRLEVPEGWARTTNGVDVTFVSKLDGLSVKLAPSNVAPTVSSLSEGPIKTLENDGKAVKVVSVKPASGKTGAAVELVYHSNSRPDPVTGKRVRLENNAYFYYRNGTLAELRMWAPLGADNVDQWLRIASSFGWTQ